ncbi:hypothetical protein [Bradyrhizobium sp. McL0616]|uniref:hypothetical protein n=1 Tax=Bradyrhizobium sp. McL0616 TaxID=3415674 RepID=UPI003CEF4B09
MDDDVGFDRQRGEELWLIKAFLSITDSGKREKILELAEQLADEASSDPPILTFTSAEASVAEPSSDVPGRTE